MRQLTLALALCCAAFNASAYDADFSIDCSVVNPTCQSDFRSISRDITAALDYKALGPRLPYNLGYAASQHAVAAQWTRGS